MKDHNIAAVYALRVPPGQEAKAKMLTEVLAESHGLTAHNYVNLSSVLSPATDNRAPKFGQGLITLMADGASPDIVVSPTRNTTYLSLTSGHCVASPQIVETLGLKSDNPALLLSETRSNLHVPYHAKNFAHFLRERLHTKLAGHWSSIFVIASHNPVIALSSRGRQFSACAYMYEGVILVMFANFWINAGQDADVNTMMLPLRHHQDDNSMFLMLQGKYLFTKVNTWCSTVAKSPYELCYITERFINRNIL